MGLLLYKVYIKYWKNYGQKYGFDMRLLAMEKEWKIAVLISEKMMLSEIKLK